MRNKTSRPDNAHGAADAVTAPGSSGSGTEKPQFLGDIARIAMAAGSVFVVGLLIALGVEGDLLTRIVRNHPIWVSLAFVAVIFGLTLPLVVRHSKFAQMLAEFGGLFLVVGGGLVTVYVAAASYQDRELPALSIKPTWSQSAGGSSTLTIDASALSLKTNEDLFVRVAGIRGAPMDEIRDACRSDAIDTRDEVVSVLWWATSGPDTSGKANITATVPANLSEFDYICAVAALRNRPNPNSHRSVWALIDLNRPIPSPIPSPSAASLPAIP